MADMTIGLNLYTLRTQCADLPGLRYTLTRLKEIGYTAVQVSGVAVAPEAVAGALKESGLKCVATHMGWPEIRDNTQRVIDIHEMYGCANAAIGALPKEYLAGVSGIDRFARELPGPAQKLAQAGMTLSYHNHHSEFARFGGKTWLETLYERTSPHLFAELDTYWVQTGGADPVAWIRKMAGRQVLLHAKDRAVTLTGEERFAEVGEGNLNWPEIIRAAEESGVHYVLVEQDNVYERDPFEAAEISYRALASLGLK